MTVENHTLPLAGIKILDMSRVLAGPWCAQMLADFGAEVIKIERPGSGDDSRAWGPPFYVSPDGKQRVSAYYCCANRGKKSVCLDLDNPEDLNAIRALILESDVLIENFKVGALRRFGLDYASLSAIHPALIYCSITGFGQTGPYASRPGYDSIVQGMGGMMSVTGEPDGKPGGGPQKTGIPIIDLMTGVYACNGILMALRERDRSSQGQHLDISLLDVQVSTLSTLAANYLESGELPGRHGNEHPTVVPGDAVQCADGPLMLMVGNDRQFIRLCKHLGLPEIATDPRFGTNEHRVRYKDDLMPLIRRGFETASRQHWLDLLLPEGIPCGPINTIAEVFADEQVQARKCVVSTQHDIFGNIRSVGTPIHMSRTPARATAPPAVLGEHTDAVLASLDSAHNQIPD
ncbi:CaiB/BaiF CoA transferase family protein [Pollutimonas bauzanensis]|uniref:Crotonobetainyl-CoA:carnitine CoA-transferase CaiB n=1 Tax=Pollutimonas bauzanensis TaxID=658167 RepID=A0A1M5SEE2_9BURK|nr:CoA transferase [Pollutimonas bauzanensis]SHH36805.1 Crotonobetainyl-CoA:carnitine CoA-transferase CaiB [Pollutimonas bauzanensis]